MPDSPLDRLSALGQSVWIDYLSRDLLHSGRLAQLMDRDAVTGVTSNPTIFQKAISQGTVYDEQMRDLLEHEEDPKEIFVALAGRDIGEGCDLMRKVWDEGRGLRGYVSMEVDPSSPRHGRDDRRGAPLPRADLTWPTCT
jgi:transaldolase